MFAVDKMRFFELQFLRTLYPDFVHRFIIIKPKEVHECGADLKAGTKAILESIKEMDDKWRLGHTKVFFRAGAMGCVEEVREESIKAILLHIQAMCRRWVHNEGYRFTVLWFK